MYKISLVMCNDMHMDIEQANEILSCIYNNPRYQITSDYTKADIIIIMTCAFGTGKEYSMYVIADIQQNCKQDATIIVTGCLVKINSYELQAISGIVIIKTISEIKEFLGECKPNVKLIPQNKVIISSGCLKRCSYCVYPLITGNYVSKPIEAVMKEVESLYESEITIYISGGLETSDYGIDLYGTHKFPDLLGSICSQYPNCNYVIGWFHPAGLTDELLSVIAKHKNIAEIMVHIQHVNRQILHNMNRPSFDFTNERLLKLKDLRPDIMISTEVIVGFPGETEKEFEELVRYLDKGLFQDIGVASYEPVLGTKAATLPNIPSLETRNERMEYIGNRYHCTTYSAPKSCLEPVLESYMKACNHFYRLPKMIKTPKARQKYKYIAGVDTKAKEPEQFGMILAQIFKEIVNARDELAIARMKKYMSETYTLEFRQYVYQVFKQSNLKTAMLKKAKVILFEK